MKVDVSKEILFTTARSGGKGGQHVNKVETMVEGTFHIDQSALLNPQQKRLIQARLANKINAAGYLQVRSQRFRSQLANKEDVIRKMNELVEVALRREKKRIGTQPTQASKEKRLQGKKKKAEVKGSRKRIRWGGTE